MFFYRSPWENLCLILFIAGALYAVITVKDRASYLSTIDNLKEGKYTWNRIDKSHNVVVNDTKDKILPRKGNIHARYCRICQHNVPGKDHHCVWVDACISHTNIYPFIAFLVCIFLTLIHAGLLFLTSVCDHTSLSSLLSVPWSSEVRRRYYLSSLIAYCIIILLYPYVDISI